MDHSNTTTSSSSRQRPNTNSTTKSKHSSSTATATATATATTTNLNISSSNSKPTTKPNPLSSSTTTLSSFSSNPLHPSNSYATQQTQDRALSILANHQSLMRYAIANDTSVPQVRLYFEMLAAGFKPEPVVRAWLS